MPRGAVANVRPTFEEHPPGAILLHDVETALKAHKIAPRFALLPTETHKRFDSLPGSAHQFAARAGCVADTTFHVEAKHFKLRAGIQRRSEGVDRLGNRAEFWPPGAAHGNEYFSHASRKCDRQILTVVPVKFHAQISRLRKTRRI